MHVRQTGVAKEVSGLQSTEAILTMMMNATDTSTAQSGTMAVTNDMWLVPEIPGYAEMRDFSVRMGQQMGAVASGSGFDMNKLLGSQQGASQALSSQPGASEAMTSLVEEMRKIQGVPVLQVMRIGTTTNGQPLARRVGSSAAAQLHATAAERGRCCQAGRKLRHRQPVRWPGRLWRVWAQKLQAPPPQPAPATDSQTPPPTSIVLIESQTQSSNFSSGPVDEVHFQIPAGYKQIQPATPHAP